METRTTIHPATKFATEVISSYGSGIAVGLQGTKEEIERAFNRYFNLRIAGVSVRGTAYDMGHWANSGKCRGDGLLHYIGDNFAYFTTTRESMVYGLMWENVRQWQDTPISKQYKGEPERFLVDAQQAAVDTFEMMIREDFMLEQIERDIDGYSQGANTPDWDED